MSTYALSLRVGRSPSVSRLNSYKSQYDDAAFFQWGIHAAAHLQCPIREEERTYYELTENSSS